MYAAINGSMGSDPARLKRTLKVNELFVALGFAAAGPLVSWLSIVGDSSPSEPGENAATLGGNNPNGSATYLGVGGFRLPFQVTGFLVLGNAVWLAGTPGASPPAPGASGWTRSSTMNSRASRLEPRSSALTGRSAARGGATGVPSRSVDATAAAEDAGVESPPR